MQSSLRLRARIPLVLRIGNSSRVIGPVVFASNWRKLAELGEQHPGSPALVDPGLHDPREPLAAGSTGPGPHCWSATPLIHYSGSSSAKQAPRVSGISFAARLRANVDDHLDAIDATILRCIDVQRVRGLLERVQHRADPFSHEVLRHALNLAIGYSSVPELAVRLRLTERTLQRRCTALAIPPPKALLSLARIFAVERLAEWSRQPSGAVAVALGFSHRANYRRLVRRHLGQIPSVIRKRGGTRHVEDIIVRTLATPRDRSSPGASSRA